MRIRFSVICVLALFAFAVAPVLQPAVFSRPAFAQTVNNIAIEGNVRVENETIFSYMPISPGDNVDDQTIDDAIKDLFQTGLFRDVRMNLRGSTLVITVVENPLINVVNFEGNDVIDDQTLAKEVQVRERMIFTKARVASDNRRIIELYQRQGYYNVTVVPKLIRLPENRINLVFEINEGVKTRVRQVSFEGNESFSDWRLRDAITTKQYSWYRFFARNTNYDEARIEADKELLRRFYLKYGYADVEILGADVQSTEDGNGFVVTFRIHEGQRYEVGDVAVNIGDANLDPVPLQRAVKTPTGRRYNAEKVDKTVEQLTLEAAKQGYVFAKVDPQLDKTAGSGVLNIQYNITEGPRTYIERIDIEGNDRTLDYVIRRELLLYEGDAYNKALVERARRRLVALDFFQSIDFADEPGSAPDKVVLVVKVVEKSTGSLSFSAGYSSVETVIGSVTLAERNLFGRGYQAKLAVSASFKKQAIDASFTDPYFLDMPIAAGFDIFANKADTVSSNSYKSRQIGGALRAGFKLNEDTSVIMKYTLAYRDVDAVNPKYASPAIIEQSGETIKSSFGMKISYDALDHPQVPTTGFKGVIDAEVAGLGGDARYASIEGSGWFFVPLFEDQVILKFEGNAGYMQPLGKDIAIEDRFFKGGNSFRGFAPLGVGPFQRGNDGKLDAIGAQSYAIGTVEAFFPLPFVPETLGLGGAVFTDFGTVFGADTDSVAYGSGNCSVANQASHPTKQYDCDVYDKAAFRLSIGAGLVWNSPFGPLRFDVAYPLLKKDTDVAERFAFSLGTRF
ncbi:MAG: outer membrane protein assembly factor BamA [Proteobacteria bacterium]|nr:outer membrane protein assembly factor BamA [Pseudomonadota bacterium]